LLAKKEATQFELTKINALKPYRRGFSINYIKEIKKVRHKIIYLVTYFSGYTSIIALFGTKYSCDVIALC